MHTDLPPGTGTPPYGVLAYFGAEICVWCLVLPSHPSLHSTFRRERHQLGFTMPTRRFCSVVLFALLLDETSSFALVSSGKPSSTTSALHLFGGLKGAFSNDDSLGKREDAGIKGGAKFNDQVTFNGKPIRAVPGQKVSQVAAAARVKITYSCKKGDCGTCEITMNGRMIKACQATIPAGKCDMRTL